MSQQGESYLIYILSFIVLIVGAVFFLTVLPRFIEKSEIIAFIAVAILIVAALIFGIRAGNRTAREDALVNLLTVTTTRIFSLVDETQKSRSLQQDTDHDQQFEEIRDELTRLRNALSHVRNSDRFKRLNGAEAISGKITSVVEKIDSARRNEDSEEFYQAFQGNGNIILDVYRIIKELKFQDNWIRAR